MNRSAVPGALVVLVIPGSAALAAGLSAGDVIVAMDGQPVRNERQPGILLRGSAGSRHDMSVVGPDGTARAVRLDARATPPSGLDDLATAQVAASPSPASRLLFAQVAADAATALAVLDDLLVEFPGVAEAYAARAQRLVDVGVARNDRSPERLSAIGAAVDRAVAIDADSLGVQVTAARVTATLRDYAAAAAHAQRAAAIDDSSSVAHYLLGAARLDQGDAIRAVTDLQRAVELDPYASESYGALSQAYKVIGRPELARQTDAALKTLQSPRQEPGPSAGELWKLALAIGFAAGSGALATQLGRRPWPRTEVSRSGVRQRGLAAVEMVGVLALVSIAVPWIGRMLELSTGAPLTTEAIDHVIPGGIALAAAALVIARIFRSRRPPSDALVLLSGLSAFWMTATHLALMLDAVTGRVRIEVAMFHAFSGVAILTITAAIWRAPGGQTADVTSDRVRTRKPPRQGQ